MTVADRPVRVLIAGGGIAGLELLLALRVLAGPFVTITVLSGDAELAPRAMSVAEPFGRGGRQSYAWADIARDQNATLVLDKLVTVDTAARTVFTHGGRRLPYDILALTPYLATARPGRLAAAPLVELVPAVAGPASDERDAISLAVQLAEAHARHGNAEGWLQALEAARALDPGESHEATRRAVSEVAIRP